MTGPSALLAKWPLWDALLAAACPDEKAGRVSKDRRPLAPFLRRDSEWLTPEPSPGEAGEVLGRDGVAGPGPEPDWPTFFPVSSALGVVSPADVVH